MGHCLFMRKGETHTAPISGILASDLAVGSVVKLMENGVATEYLVVNQGIPSGSSLYDSSCDGTWLLRKDIYEKRQWNSSNVNDYANSTIHGYLNSTYLGLLGASEQAVIKQVKIPCVVGNGKGSVASGANGLSAKVFLPSGCEIGASFFLNMPTDGASFSYFNTSNETRIAYYNGTAAEWLLRSPRTNDVMSSHFITTSGGSGGDSVVNSRGIRPALILPLNAIFDTNTLILKGVA